MQIVTAKTRKTHNSHYVELDYFAILGQLVIQNAKRVAANIWHHEFNDDTDSSSFV
jgi:hypothetical protein